MSATLMHIIFKEKKRRRRGFARSQESESEQTSHILSSDLFSSAHHIELALQLGVSRLPAGTFFGMTLLWNIKANFVDVQIKKCSSFFLLIFIVRLNTHTLAEKN